ncbi:MAG: MarR family transcriptional regulator [Desulfobacterales bacterium]|nr:MarR family transcriptional regulator [Desulfobacterales bacterium]
MTTRISYNDCIVFLLAKANQKAQRNLKKRMKPYGLTTVQGLVLGAIFDESGLTASEIGSRLVLDNATISGVLDRLMEGGWIVKKSDENDRRVQRIYLATDENAEVVDELFKVRADANEETLAELSIEERVLLKRLLRDLK